MGISKHVIVHRGSDASCLPPSYGFGGGDWEGNPKMSAGTHTHTHVARFAYVTAQWLPVTMNTNFLISTIFIGLAPWAPAYDWW